MAESTGYSPTGVDSAPEPSPGQQEASRRLIEALEQVGREVEIAAMTLDGCSDLEGTAYHCRRALAHLKFAGGLLVDLRKRKSVGDG